MNLKHLTHLVVPYMFIFVLVLTTVGAVYWNEPLELLKNILAAERYWISLGVYTFLLALATVIAPLAIVPTVPFMAKIFGPFAILLSTWTGWMIGAIVVFFLTRRYGAPMAEKFFSVERLKKIQQRMPRHLDFWVLLLLRVFIPVDILSYTVGLFSTISFRKYIVATGIGIVPFAFIFSYGPDALISGNTTLLFSFFFFLFLILGSLAVFSFSGYTRPKVKIYTHNGKFHTDDVFAVATLQMIMDQTQRRYEVIRTRDEQKIAKAITQAEDGDDVYIVDTGGSDDIERNLFDHHQVGGAGTRDNGVEYGSFGLVWKKYGARLCDDRETAESVDERLVQSIDALDNGQQLYLLSGLGVEPITLNHIIEDLYRQSDSSNALGQDSDFEHAVELAKSLISRAIVKSREFLEKEKRAGQLYAQSENKKIIVTEEYVGRSFFTKFDQALIIVTPRTEDTNGRWGVTTVPKDKNGQQGRISFPESWWGLRDKELQDASEISGALFCHRSGDYLCVAHSRKSAVEMAEKTIALFENAS